MTQQEYEEAEPVLYESNHSGSAPLSELADILQAFKAECNSRGWQTKRAEDWIKTDNEYHNFIYSRAPVNTYSFKKIAEKSKALVVEGGSYRVVDAAYTAWLLVEPSAHAREELMQILTDDPVIPEKTALYCFHRATSNTLTCKVLNSTKSQVFKEFEKFLREKVQAELKPITISWNTEGISSKAVVCEP